MAKGKKKPNSKNQKAQSKAVTQKQQKQSRTTVTQKVQVQSRINNTQNTDQNRRQRPYIIKQMPPPEIKIYSKTQPHKPITKGQKAADVVAKYAGSWTFITVFIIFLIIWMVINVCVAISLRWDPYPFILLNLVLSCLAAIQAPIILMSQNRAADRDRSKAERDYAVNRKSEKELEDMQKDLDYIKKKLAEIARK